MTFRECVIAIHQRTTGAFIEMAGGFCTTLANCSAINTLTYAASIAIDAKLGSQAVVTVTDGVAFVFQAPTGLPPTGYSMPLSITIRNASGGALGAGTWNAVFLVTGAIPAIANGKNRTFTFFWNGTNWVQTFATAVDIPN